MITESDAKEFQELYEKETGKKITLEEAFDMAESLVEMVQLTYKPIKKCNKPHKHDIIETVDPSE